MVREIMRDIFFLAQKSEPATEADSEEIMEAYLQSGKSLDEVMTFLKP